MPQSTLSVFNPSSGEEIARLKTDDGPAAAAKLERAWQRYNDRSSWLELHRRIEILERLVGIMQRDEDAYAQLIAAEGGKPLKDARVEAARAIAGVRIAINTISEHRGNVIPLGHQAASAGRLAFTQHFPRGVVLAFSAFNHPLNLIVHQVIPAFATGCPCVVKPAADTPLSCIKLVEAMHEAGVPEDYLAYSIPRDLEVAGEMVRSEHIAFFSFIGSARVGWMLRSKLQPGVRCALEHGGVAPCIVTGSARLELAVPAITKGGFYHAGQVCVSTQRIYVQESLHDILVDMLRESVGELVVGDASDAATDVGPLIRAAEVQRVHEWVEEAVSLGGKLALGGEPLGGNFYQPSILLDPPREARLSSQEVFGPVVCIYPYAELEQALDAANLHPHAFQASVFSENVSTVQAAFQRIHASALMINDHTAFRDDAMPFAGLDASGLGVGGIPYTIEDMQFEKMLVLKDGGN
ncbi:MAG: aldehyde dehydrogenase family protein [Halieaceae bacterium]|jgi:acyl-CoA reductase-like NAD-dependent aldehyde dehydrogenase|nr:aldehyde dehydrogenase family protein [Halieaceae bacterium]